MSRAKGTADGRGRSILGIEYRSGRIEYTAAIAANEVEKTLRTYDEFIAVGVVADVTVHDADTFRRLSSLRLTTPPHRPIHNPRYQLRRSAGRTDS